MVPARSDTPRDERPFSLPYPPRHASRSPFSRAPRATLAVDFPTRNVVFLKDYWRAGLECEKASNSAPVGRGDDGTHHKPLTESWAVPTQGTSCLSHYRMTLAAVGESLTGFASSREFVGAIADAMEAHDDAYFAARILHRDVSVGNILFAGDKKGVLIDWDRCDNLASDNVGARRPSRMGTWHFMSATRLDRPSRPHQIEDDRKSAFHVLLWLALRYTESRMHDTPPRLRGAATADVGPASPAPDTTCVPRNDVVRLMRGYDEAYVDGRGVARGGVVKQAFFTSDVLSRLEFSGCTGLDALVKELVTSLKVRYEDPPTPHDIKILEKHEAMMAEFPDIPNREKWRNHFTNIRDGLPAHTYPIRLGHLTARHLVVDTIRKHLETGNWPHDRVAPPQEGKS
ncbi:hypothetical protein BJ912DRAFT_974826 [Pholiota molesta]|nr:hypothetical protein BJ912DRAFT_974826 [Pholiota molesta]